MTRYEAAALLNACLDRVTEVTDELRRLMAEFETELAILKGRVDGLEAKVGELEATQFATTTKLKGYTTWITGVSKSGRIWDENEEEYVNSEAVTINYDLALNFLTSFNGTDLLTATLRAGNFGSSIFGNELTYLETAASSQGKIKVDRLNYSFEINEQLSVSIGPVISSDDPSMHAGYASYYSADILDFFTYGGSVTTVNLDTGSGVGFVYRIPNSGFKVSGNYVSENGHNSSDGIGTRQSISTSAWQVFFEQEVLKGNLLGQLGYAYSQNAPLNSGTTETTNNRNNYSISTAWKPYEAGTIPSISIGYSGSTVQNGPNINSWYVGVQWDAVFTDGNSFGGAIGSSPYANDFKGNTMWEMFYSAKLNDNITISPAIFRIDEGGSLNEQFGGVIKTTFIF